MDKYGFIDDLVYYLFAFSKYLKILKFFKLLLNQMIDNKLTHGIINSTVNFKNENTDVKHLFKWITNFPVTKFFPVSVDSV